MTLTKAGLLLITAIFWVLCYWRVLDWQSVDTITLADGLKQLKSGRTQFNLANIYLMNGRQDEALVAYRRSIFSDPQQRDAQPLYHAGQILLYKGQYVEAEQYLYKAVTGYFSPLTLAEEEVFHDYGLALWHVGRGADAVQNFHNAVITNPQFPKGYNNLACALVLMGLWNKPANMDLVNQGLQAIERAVTLVPQHPLYWRNAASLLQIAGDAPGAQNAWQRYYQIDPAGAQAASAGGTMPQDCQWDFYFR